MIKIEFVFTLFKGNQNFIYIMCGIFAYLGLSNKELKSYANKIQHRGPDNSISKLIKKNLYFNFHRLKINGLDNESNQPFHINGVWLICNGEIYNFRTLKNLNSFDYKTHSDCEIIIHL